jgi:sugar lactone lactonase YvrE
MPTASTSYTLTVTNPSGSAVSQTANVNVVSAVVVSTLAGMADIVGSANGTGASARFYEPQGVAVDGSENVYVGDSGNNTIRIVTPTGVASTLVGGLSNPIGVAVDGSGNVYEADYMSCTIRMITPVGVVSILAGTAGKCGSDNTGLLWMPTGVAVDGAGNVYVADSHNNTIDKITPAFGTGISSILAGTPGQNGNADGTGAAARFNEPQGVAVDTSGNVYVADCNNNSIRVITPEGVVSTLAGWARGSADGDGKFASFNTPLGVAVDGSGNVYVADTGNSTIRMITPTGVVSTLAGVAGIIGSSDGTGAAARFNGPQGVAVDRSGNVYVADTGNDTIRKITF